MLPRNTLLLFCLFIFPLTIIAQPPGERVLVVYNANVPDSRRVATYYMRKRQIPSHNACALHIPTDGSFAGENAVPWNQFNSLVRNPIRQCLNTVGADRILYIVFSFATPYRLVQGPIGAGQALDQFVADIWNDLGASSPARNPYFAEGNPRVHAYPPFVSLAAYRAQKGAKRIYSVWRLDAATPALAMGLVDRAMEAERTGWHGQACIDRRDARPMDQIPDTGYGAGEWELQSAADLLRAAGIHVVEDTHPEEFGTAPAPLHCDDAILYAGWYSLNHYNDAFSWLPGAIGIHLDSESAEDPRGGPNWAANALEHGITVTSGAVDEPYLPGLPRPDGIVHDLLAGANVGDAFLRNTLMLKWMIVNIGDPLYRPRPSP